MKLFDAHCHLQMSQFDADRGEVLARMKENEIGALVVGTDYEMSKAAIELAASHDFLWASVGLHPNDPSTSSGQATEEFDFEKYEVLAREPKVVAIGECGLDYFRSGGTDDERAAQKERFLKHIDLAEQVGKPLIIHCRNAHDDMLAILAERKPSMPVVIHFFTGSGELAQAYLDLGCYLSFPGPVTFSDMYDESIRVCPLERLLIETDSPFAAPMPHRGKRNEPNYVAEIAQKVAQIKVISPERVATTVVDTARRVFKLIP